MLEIGTSNGYSTLWLAHALAATGGELLGVDVDGPRSAEAAAHLRSTGLAGQVTLVLRDAADVLREEAGTFDLILVDAERPAYPDYLPDLRRLVDPAGGALVGCCQGGEISPTQVAPEPDDRTHAASLGIGQTLYK